MRCAAVATGLLVSVLTADASSQTIRYRVVDLTDSGSLAVAIAEDGSVAGSIRVGWDYHAFLARPGDPIIDLGTLGGPGSHPRDLNSGGVVVGFADTPTSEEGFVWRDGVMTGLGERVYPNAISDAGHLAGSFSTRLYSTRPFLMLDAESKPVDLGTHGGEFGEALDVNALGHVVGWAWDARRDRRATLWRDGSIIDLGMLPGRTGMAMAVAINEAGRVAGTISAGGDSRAFLWDDGAGMIDLGVLPEAGTMGAYGPLLTGTLAGDLNAHGQVVGNSTPPPFPGDPGRPGPWLWEAGTMVNLNDLIDPASGWVIRYAVGINDAGSILAEAQLDGGANHAVLLEPICSADCDGSGVLDFFDFACFQDLFAAGDSRADCDASGDLSFFDFLCFQNLFAGGCD